MLFKMIIISISIYIYGFPITSLLLALLDMFIQPDINNVYYLINSIVLNLFGYMTIFIYNILVFIYYLVSNYDNIIKYINTLRNIIKISWIIYNEII